METKERKREDAKVEPSARTRRREDGLTSQLPPDESEQNIKYDNLYTPNNRTFYEKFQYVSLIPTKPHIRLLRIHPLHINE
jgi:hypothetical protein